MSAGGTVGIANTAGGAGTAGGGGVADVVVLGAGVSGLATATRLQAAGLSTVLLEAHSKVGGCAGWFRRRGFTFDVGATTLVDFEPGGVGGLFLADVGLPPVVGEVLPGYRAWLPDRTVTLHRDRSAWAAERARAFGDTAAHRRFWRLLDGIADAFWEISRTGPALPLRSPLDLLAAARAVPVRDWPRVRHLGRTVDGALASCGLAGDVPLRTLLAMVLQDTVHALPDTAPLVNGALGATIRGAGLTRAQGGMRGFHEAVQGRYAQLGGDLRLRTPVSGFRREDSLFAVTTPTGEVLARQLVSALTIWDTARLGPPEVGRALRRWTRRDAGSLGGAITAYLGVPASEVDGQELTHHAVLDDDDAPLGDGNNMFVSVSAPGDTASAPAGQRAVMLSTHCGLAEWEGLSRQAYAERKAAAGRELVRRARRVHPQLGDEALVALVGTPHTFATYTGRHAGAVGGVRQTLRNTNQFAVPYDVGVTGFWQAGDTTWPGLGTVACVLGSRHVAAGVLAANRSARRSARSIAAGWGPGTARARPVPA